MAFASFFDKSVLSLGTLLRGTGAEQIGAHLSSCTVGLCWDSSIAHSTEARFTLELAVDLLARLYPRIALIPIGVGPEDDSVRNGLTSRASDINDAIDVVGPRAPLIAALVVGDTPVPWSRDDATQTIYIGSDDWTALISTDGPVGSGPGANPFGAGAAACLGAAAVFRRVFQDFLRHPSEELVSGNTQALSIIDMRVGRALPKARPRTLSDLDAIDVGETFLVGVGAIGNAATWALARTPRLTGTVHAIDGQRVDLSNLQRYVLASRVSVGQAKVEMAAEAFDAHRASCNTLAFRSHHESWAPFVHSRNDYRLDRVLLALDSAQDRVAVQAALPRWIANAWTQPENLGVSRHRFGDGGPCIACLYYPTGAEKNKDQLYAETLRCTTAEELMEVRALLHNGKPVGRDLIERLAIRLGVPSDELLRFEHSSLESLYVGALCGGLVFRLGGGFAVGPSMEVPMAFQSALAGILLAAELVVDAGGLRTNPLPARSEIDLLRFSSHGGTVRLNSPHAPLTGGRCICQDSSYRRAFALKYAAKALREVRRMS